jgi:hypothetical protein
VTMGDSPTRSFKNKTRGPAQRYVLDGDVILLRKINVRKVGANIMDMLARTNLRPGELEGDMPWFLDGYVAGEQPRSIELTEAIIAATTGFAVARTDSGDIMVEFNKDEAQKAEDTAHSAKTTLAVDVNLEHAVEEDEDD